MVSQDGQHSAGHPRLQVLSQYIRDLSCEVFRAPPFLGAEGKRNLNMGIQVHRVPPDEGQMRGVAISLTARATDQDEEGSQQEGRPIFHLEVAYEGIFILEGVPEGSVEPTLLVEGPRYLFPFLRHVVATITHMAGLPPVTVDPVDFALLYQKSIQDASVVTKSAQPDI